MTARRPPAKGGINWTALNFVLALAMAIASGIAAWFTFNSTIVSDVAATKTEIAVLKQQVADLRENQRELLAERRERERRE